MEFLPGAPVALGLGTTVLLSDVSAFAGHEEMDDRALLVARVREERA